MAQSSDLCYTKKNSEYTMKIAVLVSGGVDSSVALALLKEQGHDVTAFYLKIWLEDELSYLGTCPWEEDLQYVRAVCEQLNVPLEVVSLQTAYWNEVVSYTIDEIKRGNTPNPDILCNSRVKFGAFLKAIEGYDKIATGHYAQVFCENGRYYLRQAPDAIKDQTYFLSHLTQDQLARVLFPIGHLCKSEVRELARKYNLPNKDRKDSQGICFLGKLKFSDFIKFHVGERKGDLVEYETGKKVGEHNGFWFFTRGQRQGIGLSGGPWYVVDKNSEKNIVYISRNYYSAEKSRSICKIKQVNWFSGKEPSEIPLTIKLRHGPQQVPCSITQQEDGMYQVQLASQDQGIAPGQFAVFYHNQVCLGSGILSD